MNQPRGKNQRGRWQLPIFTLSLVLASIVWVLFPEPEESRQGYTAAGCYLQARHHFAAASVSSDIYRRSQFFAAAIKYLDALETRFGVSQSRNHAYEMLGDASVALADVSEFNPNIAEQLRLASASEIRNEALRAYREAAARAEYDSDTWSRLKRKEAEVLLHLDRPADAFDVLGVLVRRYRKGDIERLRQEREEGVAFQSGGKLTGAFADEVRTVYFLAGTAARAAKKVSQRLAREAVERGEPGRAAEQTELVSGYSDEIDRAFGLFLNAGGAGDRRAAAETALGDLSFELASAASGESKTQLLGRARNHYASANTPEAALLEARALFALGNYQAALDHFRPTRPIPASERRARHYMEARCLLALDRHADAESLLVRIRADDADDAEAAAALVDLSEIANRRGDLKRSAELLTAAVAMRGVEGGDVLLPERDERIQSQALVVRILSLAGGFENLGNTDRAIELYQLAVKSDPVNPQTTLRRIASALERKAAASGSSQPYVEAGATYLELATGLDTEASKREALLAAAESYARGGALTEAIVVARGYLEEFPDGDHASRLTNSLGTWEKALGLASQSASRLRENILDHESDIYADRSRIELAELLATGRGRAELEEAQALLREVLEDDRYGKTALTRLRALFELGRVDLLLAEDLSRADRKMRAGTIDLLTEAVAVSSEALSYEPTDFPRSGRGARPLFAEAIATKRPNGFLNRGIALYRLHRYEDASSDLRKARDLGAGTIGALYESLAACRLAETGRLVRGKPTEPAPVGTEEAAWDSTCTALRLLNSGDVSAAVAAAKSAPEQAGHASSKPGLLPQVYWQRWSEWIAAHAGEGIENDRDN